MIMKKLSFLAAFLCASVLVFADPVEEKGVNFALASNGSSATASSGNAALAIDGDEGTRWESASTDDETWTLDMGQARIINMINILWEGAYCKEFTISYSTDGTNYTVWHNETELASAGWQKLYKETKVTARYIQYHGTKRATGYGQSFFEFQVMLGDAPKEYTEITGLTIVANSEGENDVNRVIDGNNGTEWQGRPAGMSGGDEAARTFDAWFVVDLGGFYTVEKVDIKFEGACSQEYHVDFSLDNTNWQLGYNYVGTAGIHGYTAELTELDNNQKVRYVRFWSTKAATEWGMKIFEFRVFGKEWVDDDDTEKPVMVSATLDSKTWNSVVIAVAATDNHEVVKYHVVDASKEIDVKCSPTAGKISINGLTSATAYNFTITALDAANNESANSKTLAVTTNERIIVPSASAPTPTWPATQVKSIYSDAYTFAPASLNSYNEGWWDNPRLTEETVGEDHYLHYDLYRNGMIGAQFAETSVASMEKIHIDVFASAAGTITFRPITAGDADAINANKKTLTLEALKWNSFDFDMADFGEHNWTKLFQFAIEGYQAGSLVGEHISVDNIYFYRTTALVDNEKPTNVSGSMASATYFSVVLALKADDNSGAVSFVVKDGAKEVATGGGASGATINVTVPGLKPNTNYTFSVIAKDESGNEADAINVDAKTADGAPAAAPAPDFTKKEAVAVFCDALDGGPAIKIGGWGQTTVAQVVELAEGDKAFYCSNMNYLGWELTPAVDATEMEYVHVDFFATEITKISLTPISPGKEGVFIVNLTAGEWNSVDVALDNYDANAIAWENIFQFKFMDATPAGKELFIDNVYFYKDSAETAIDQVIEPLKAKKIIENGQLVIIRDGRKYNVLGTQY